MLYNVRIRRREFYMEQELSILLIEDDPDTCRNFADYIDTKSDVTLIGVTNNSYRAIELLRKR